ncbi:MAG: GTPase Era [Gammaproteobacteria bacterium]|nr:MAG: GTPase Era [Gammaproteobacteria bacterium]
MSPSSRSGVVAIVGRPNVGKSTLLNHILGQKLSITSRRPQTTRQHLLGVLTRGRDQIVFVDTPGLQLRPGKRMNRAMNREVETVLPGVDLVLFVVEALRWTAADENVLRLLRECDLPVLLVVNKVDRVQERERLLPWIEERVREFGYREVIPLCARRKRDVEHLLEALIRYLPEGPHLYPEDHLTDRSERFLAAEIVREKLMRLLGEELPYSVGVSIESFHEQGKTLHIDAVIWVERPGQKPIIIGHQGRLLKKIGTQARRDMERLFGRKVMLHTWVKVREDWTEDERALKQLGFDI